MSEEATVAEFNSQGFVLLRGFYERARIEEVTRGIYDIIGQVLIEAGLDDRRPRHTLDDMDAGYLGLLGASRTWGSVIYDAVKQVPGLVRLVSDIENEALVRTLRPDSVPGLAAGGFGVRINNPHEAQFLAPWHQEYPAQLRSLNGLVFWTPLVPVLPSMGPVRILKGSHREGPLPVRRSRNGGGAYELELVDAERLVTSYEVVEPLTMPGDLLVMDFSTVHASGANVADRALWSVQSRWFDFTEPIGRSHGWCGSYAAGVDFAAVHPELLVEVP